METILSTDTAILFQLIHPGALLFALTVLLFGSAFTLCFLIGSKPSVIHPLICVLFVILFLMSGNIAIEFSAAATPSYAFGEFASLSEALSTHRWLLYQLPIILTITSLMILSVYRKEISQRHATQYRTAVLVSTTLSFASLLAIAFESMI